MIRRLVAKVAAAVVIFALFALHGATNLVTNDKGVCFLSSQLSKSNQPRNANYREYGFLCPNTTPVNDLYKTNYYFDTLHECLALILNKERSMNPGISSQITSSGIKVLKCRKTWGTIVNSGNTINFKLDTGGIVQL
jgi:hypothetical protein